MRCHSCPVVARAFAHISGLTATELVGVRDDQLQFLARSAIVPAVRLTPGTGDFPPDGPLSISKAARASNIVQATQQHGFTL